MNVRQPGIEKSRSIDDLQCLRLMALLDELVRENAVSGSTADLDVDHRTPTANLESGRLARRMRVALDDNQGQTDQAGDAAPAAAGAGPGDVLKVAATGGGRFPVGFRKFH